MIRFLLALLAVITSNAAAGSDLSLGPKAVQELVTEQLFTEQGRWYLLDNGPCRAYLEHPKTHLTDGRIVLDAHLSAHVGIPLGDRCVGSDFNGNVTLSGKPIGKGSSLRLDDIRVDRADNDTPRDVINLIQQIIPQDAFSFDVLAAARSQVGSAVGIPVSVKQFRIVRTATRREAVLITFEMSLSAP